MIKQGLVKVGNKWLGEMLEMLERMLEEILQMLKQITLQILQILRLQILHQILKLFHKIPKTELKPILLILKTIETPIQIKRLIISQYQGLLKLFQKTPKTQIPIHKLNSLPYLRIPTQVYQLPTSTICTIHHLGEMIILNRLLWNIYP